MKVINGILFCILFVLFGIWVYGRKQKNRKGWQQFLQTHMYMLAVLFVANVWSICLSLTKDKGQIYIQREGYAGEERDVGLHLKGGEEEKEIILTVQPRTYTKEEQEEKLKEAFAYLDTHIRGKNENLSKVEENLDFSLDYDAFPFEEEVRPDDYSLLDEEGNVHNEKEWLVEEGYGERDFQKGVSTGVMITLRYGETEKKKYYEFLLFPKEIEGVEKTFAEISDKIKKQEKETIHEEAFSIPGKMDDVVITDAKGKTKSPVYVLGLGVLLCGLLFLKEQEEKREEEQKRNSCLLRCYPWFVNEMVLMLGAGMQVKNIIAMMLADYETEKKREGDDREPLMAELLTAQAEIHMGMPEQQVYYRLGRRLKLPCYIKLMTLLEQNVKRGTRGLTAFFEQEEMQALEERKNMAKRYGEEAGTKLLGPMMVLLLVIMLMIMIPAFMSFMI